MPFDNGLKMDDLPVDNDTQSPIASGSSKARQISTQRDSEKPSQLPQKSITSKGKEPIREESSPPPLPSTSVSERRHGLDLQRKGLWVLALFNDRTGNLVYDHLDAQARRTDFTLFTELREKYYGASSWWNMFSRLRQVSAIRVVRVRVQRTII